MKWKNYKDKRNGVIWCVIVTKYLFWNKYSSLFSVYYIFIALPYYMACPPAPNLLGVISRRFITRIQNWKKQYCSSLANATNYQVPRESLSNANYCCQQVIYFIFREGTGRSRGSDKSYVWWVDYGYFFFNWKQDKVLRGSDCTTWWVCSLMSLLSDVPTLWWACSWDLLF